MLDQVSAIFYNIEKRNNDYIFFIINSYVLRILIQ